MVGVGLQGHRPNPLDTQQQRSEEDYDDSEEDELIDEPLPITNDDVKILAGLPEKTVDYLDERIITAVSNRFPWLLVLMLVQSVSGYVVSRYEGLIQQHVIIASFLTMLVGGGGNSSGQTVAELVKRLRTGEITSTHFWRVLLKESTIGLLLSMGLGMAAFPRVRLMHRGATNADAFAIALSYTFIIIMANALAVCITMCLHLFGKAAVGGPPVVQVLVDVCGISMTCLVCSAVLQ